MMNTKRKPVVGETLYIVGVGNNARISANSEVIVTKVGNKYFETSQPFAGKPVVFYIDTWKQKTDYSTNFVIYNNEKEYTDMVTKQKYDAKFHHAFSYFRNEYNIDQLRDAAKILGINVEE